MSYSKKQIAVTANFIADRLFNPEQQPHKKWFCRQFKETLRGNMQAEALIFKVGSQDFGMLIDMLREKGIAVAADFQVKLHISGKSEFQDNRTKQTIHSGKSLARGCHYTKKLADILLEDADDNVSDDDWEADMTTPVKPLLCDFIRLQLRSEPESSLQSHHTNSTLDSKMRI